MVYYQCLRGSGGKIYFFNIQVQQIKSPVRQH